MIKQLPIPGNAFEWIDIQHPTHEELETFARERGLHPNTVRDCLDPGHLPKFEELAGSVRFVIFRRYAPPVHFDHHTMQELTTKVALFYNENLLVTIHRRPAPFLEELYKRYIEGGRADQTVEVVTKILWYVLDSYEPFLEKLSAEIDKYEDSIFLNNRPIAELECRLYYLKRQATIIRHVLDQTGYVVARLHTTPEDASSLQDARDLHVRLMGAYAQVRDDVMSLLNTHLSLAAQRTNDVVRLLTIFSAFFLPLTFLAGIYGMNFREMPELEHPYGYFFTLTAMVGVAGVIYFWFKRKRWL